jgi:hypothetical protein
MELIPGRTFQIGGELGEDEGSVGQASNFTDFKVTLQSDVNMFRKESVDKMSLTSFPIPKFSVNTKLDFEDNE